MSTEANDAARYRFMREAVKTDNLRVAVQALFWNHTSRTQFDEALDALMARTETPIEAINAIRTEP